MGPGPGGRLGAPVAAVLRSWRKGMLPQRSVSNFATLLVLVAFTAMCTPWSRQYNPLLPPSKRQAYAEDEPRQVVRYLQTVGYRGRVFCPMEWSAYFVWSLRPDVTTLVDTRIDFFPDAVWAEYVEVGRGGRRWQEILQKYDVDLVVWNRHWTAALPQELGTSARWKKVFEDPLSVAFRRIDPGPSG